ncbi:MAG: hypothetical protein ACKO96_04315, partial [Flammeovirgaceae bacterium]
MGALPASVAGRYGYPSKIVADGDYIKGVNAEAHTVCRKRYRLFVVFLRGVVIVPVLMCFCLLKVRHIAGSLGRKAQPGDEKVF